MRLSIPAFKAAAFLAWVADHGGQSMPLCGQYEVARYRFPGEPISLIFKRPSKGRFTLVDLAIGHHEAFLASQPPPPSPLSPPPGLSEHDGRIVIYTDASQYHDSKAGAWAAILTRHPGGEVEASGPLNGQITSSTAAEMMAVANALHRFIRLKAVPPRSAISIICDNNAVVGYLAKGKVSKKSKSTGTKDALAYVLDLAKRWHLDIKSEWVKGHQPHNSADPRAAYNRRCDKLASAHAKRIHSERKASAAPQS